MPNRIRRILLICGCMMVLLAAFAFGASAYDTYTYPNMPSDWQNVQVTVGDVTMPFARYPAGSTYDPEKRYMTVEEQIDYGFNIGKNLDLRGWECVGFARYAYAALFYRPDKWPQNSSIDTSLAYSYAGSYAYIDMIEQVLGTRTLEAGYSAETLKKLFTACRPGAVMRCGGHSMVLMAIYNDGVLVYDANFSSGNEVSVRPYTWESFVERLGSRGIQALQMPSYYPGYSYSTGDNTYYNEMDTSVTGIYQVYNCNTLNVRAMPSTSSSRVGGLDSGTEVIVLGSYNGWYQIIYQSRARWVYSDYLRSTASDVHVTFDPNGGGVSFTSRTYEAGEQFGTLPTGSKSDRIFLGWYSGDTLYTASSTVPAVSNLTLKAKWGVLAYEDVPDDTWYAPYVETACARGLLSKGNNFYPSSMSTRAQMITALGREYEWETGQAIPDSGAGAFTDIPAWEYYAKYVNWANRAGIANGTSDTTFEPAQNITREQIAIFLYRLAIYTGRTAYSNPDMSLLSQFNDRDSISSYARASVCWAVRAGLLKGDDLGNVNPQANASRAEMITMLCRYMDYAKPSAATRAAALPGEETPETAEAFEAEEEEVPATFEDSADAVEADGAAPMELPAAEIEAGQDREELDPELLPDELGAAG